MIPTVVLRPAVGVALAMKVVDTHWGNIRVIFGLLG